LEAVADDASGEQVVIVRWPEESARLARLRTERVSRLLLIPPDSPVPSGGDCEEDWIRLPADDRDVRARLVALASRAARHHATRPALDDHGLLTLGMRSTVLSPLAAALATVLVERYGETVPRDALMTAWPDEHVTGNALRIAILRLRRRVAALGLEVRTVPGHGYRLQRASR
jgi:DNA-binding response OmpR family regulator